MPPDGLGRGNDHKPETTVVCDRDSGPHHQQPKKGETTAPAPMQPSSESCWSTPKHILKPLPLTMATPLVPAQSPPPSWPTGGREPFWNVSLNHRSRFTAPTTQRTKSSQGPPMAYRGLSQAHPLLICSHCPLFPLSLRTQGTRSLGPLPPLLPLPRARGLQTRPYLPPSLASGALLRRHRLTGPFLATCLNGNTPNQLCPLFESHFKSYLLTQDLS